MSHYDGVHDIATFTQAIMTDDIGKLGGEYNTNQNLQKVLMSIKENPNVFLDEFDRVNTYTWLRRQDIAYSIRSVRHDMSGRPEGFIVGTAIWLAIHH